MLYWLFSKAVNVRRGALAATESAGVSGVIPLTPESHVRHSRDAARSDRDTVNIGNAVWCRDEIEPSAVGRKLGVAVTSGLEPGKRAHSACPDIELTDPIIAKLEGLRIRRKTVRDPCDLKPVRRPLRIHIGVRIVGQLAHRTGPDIKEIQVENTALHRGERDLAAVA